MLEPMHIRPRFSSATQRRPRQWRFQPCEQRCAWVWMGRMGNGSLALLRCQRGGKHHCRRHRFAAEENRRRDARVVLSSPPGPGVEAIPHRPENSNQFRREFSRTMRSGLDSRSGWCWQNSRGVSAPILFRRIATSSSAGFSTVFYRQCPHGNARPLELVWGNFSSSRLGAALTPNLGGDGSTAGSPRPLFSAAVQRCRRQPS